MVRYLFFAILIMISSCKQKDISDSDNISQNADNQIKIDNFDSEYGKPLVVFRETKPEPMILNSIIPDFVLYENGQILYRLPDRNKIVFNEVLLKKREVKRFLLSLGITKDLIKLDDNILASYTKSENDCSLTINIGKTKKISVHGSLSDIDVRFHTPYPFLRVYDKIKSYRKNSAKEWSPKKIEVFFSDYNDALNIRPWIKGFPDLNSRTTTKHDNDSYSVFIDRDKFNEFFNYYSSMGDRQAVSINDRKMSISFIYQMPNL